MNQQNENDPSSRLENEILRKKVLDTHSIVFSGQDKRSVKFNLDNLPTNKCLNVQFPNHWAGYRYQDHRRLFLILHLEIVGIVFFLN